MQSKLKKKGKSIEKNIMDMENLTLKKRSKTYDKANPVQKIFGNFECR